MPMALYKHVANKDELLDGMIDVVLAESTAEDRTGLEARDTRADPLGAPGAAPPSVGLTVMESRTTPTPTVLAYFDSMIGMFTRGGFSIDLTHHVMHAMGSRLMGFSQELFNDRRTGAPVQPGCWPPMSAAFPSIYRLCWRSPHDDASVVGPGCDDQLEFEFALDLMLDGIERIQAAA